MRTPQAVRCTGWCGSAEPDGHNAEELLARAVQARELDSADSIPPGRVLLAEVDGELNAAMSLHDGSAIADPFQPTLHLLDLLRTRAAEAADRGDARRQRRLLKLRYALG